MAVERSRGRPAGVRLALVALVVASAGCGGSDAGTPPVPPALEIQVKGRLERGSTVVVTVLRDGVAVASDSVDLVVAPTSASRALVDSNLTLGAVGPVTLTATVDGLTGVTATKQLSVAAPPTIIFEGLKAANRDIYSVALDGEDLVALTTHAADDRAPTAAGGKIVFVSRRDGNAELYEMPIAGGEPARLTTTSVDENEPALSTTGGALVYIRANATGLPKLVTSNGTTHTELTSAGNASSIEATPSWSAAHDRFVYLSTQAGLGNLYVYNMLDGGHAPLPVGDAPNVEPAWHPDGNSIAFVSNRTGDTELHLITLASNNVTQLTDRDGVDAQPAWLLDGRLVYVELTGDVARLRWLDPAKPGVSHEIPTGTVVPSHPAPVR